MPAFAVIFEDDVSIEVPPDLGARHREHFTGLGERAILGGPTLNDDQTLSSRLLIGEFASLQDARAWAAAEPFVQYGRSKVSRVSPFVPVQEKGVFTPPPPGIIR